MPRAWFKSSYSVANSACVEVAIEEGQDKQVLMRDSKNPSSEILTFGEGAWNSFIEDVKGDRISRP